MTPETNFSNWLRSKMPGFSTRIENAISAGMPDIVFIYNGMTSWIETKIIPTPGGCDCLRGPQYAWGMGCANQHGRVFIIAYCPSEKHADDILVWRYPFKVRRASSKFLGIIDSPTFTTRRDAKVIHRLIPIIFPGTL